MAHKKVIYSEQSLNDLNRIVDHIASNFSQKLAIEVYEEIRLGIDSIIKFPKIGKSSRTHYLQRELVLIKNTVYYSIQDDDIVITTIRPRRTI